MKKLVVVNSFGPMASTLLSGLLEKSGFTNIPLRKIRLHQYLMGEDILGSGKMEKRLEENLAKHSEKILSGGVSVLDRSNQIPRSLVDQERVKDRLGSIDNSSIQNLYYGCRKLYCDAVTYKPVTTNTDWQIEMTVDLHRYDPQMLHNAYTEQFDDVRMIHLHRPVGKWINSLASQCFVHPDIKNRIMFFPHLRCADYDRYEFAINAMPGLHVHFDELFDTPIEELAQSLNDYIGIPLPKIDLKSESFDMYGKPKEFSIAFTRFDDGIVFLQPSTIDYIVQNYTKGALKNVIPALIAWMLYLKDMIYFHYKTINSAID